MIKRYAVESICHLRASLCNAESEEGAMRICSCGGYDFQRCDLLVLWRVTVRHTL